MTLFDFIALAILLISGLVGFMRGAVRELVTVFAFILSALAAIYLMPLSGPVARHFLKPVWVANAAAVAGVFLAAYIGLRAMAGWLTARLHEQAALGTIDRTIGLGFGVVRALVFLGVFYLVFNMATPPDLVPAWMSQSMLYPLARECGRVVGAVAPRALRVSAHIGPALERAVTDNGAGEDNAVDVVPAEQNAPSAAGSRSRNSAATATGYDKRSRDDIDALVERSR